MKVYLVLKALIRKVYLVLTAPIKKVRLLLWAQILKGYYLLLVPVDIYIILHSRCIHKTYRMSGLRKFKLGLKMYRNTRRISTGTSYKAHLAMALKILETPPDVPGDVIECGTWKGGASANLSLVCKIVNRKLKVYDSFEGLPEPEPSD
jgi:O-methyltransferase